MTGGPTTNELFEALHGLVALELVGELTDADRVRLEQLVCGNHQARRLYVEYIAETAALERYVTADFNAHAGAPGMAGVPDAASAASVDRTVGGSGVLGFLEGLVESVQASPRWLSILVLAGLGSYFGVLLATLLWERSSSAPEPLELTARPRPAAATGGEIARLVSAHDCRWQTDSQSPLVGAALGSEPLKLTAGIAQIEFSSGASVVLEAPAEFTPQDGGRSLLLAGRLVAHVPPAAVGFTVTTPTAEVVDLGTEFGLEVDGPRRTDVHVLRGAVEVKPMLADNQEGESLRLSAGQAVRVSSNGASGPAAQAATFTDIPVDRSAFDRTIDLAAVGRAWDAKPAATRLSATRPAGAAGERALSPELRFAEDFSGGGPGHHLALGPGFGAPTSSFDGAFAITSGPANRIYLATGPSNYAQFDFVFEATVSLPADANPWGDAFFGMAAGGADTADHVGEPASPSLLAVIRLDLVPPQFELRNTTAWAHSTVSPSAGATYAIADRPCGDTERLRMTWNATTRTATFAVDAHYRGRPFEADYTVTASATSDQFDATNSRLILGGGNGLRFDDVLVTDTPPSEEQK